MVVPDHVRVAANEGDIAVVKAWIHEVGPGAVNDVCPYGYTYLQRSMSMYGDITREHVEFARWLIASSGDVNSCGLSSGGPQFIGRHCTMHAAIPWDQSQ